MRAPIFIVGMPRSGTTLLSAMLDAHSRIAITPETHFYTRCGSEEGENASVEAVWECLAQQPGVQDMALSDEEVERLWGRVRARSRPRPADLLQALGATYAERSGAEVWGEKTPDHLVHVPTILRDFPRAAVLCIVRDPRDVCLSLRGLPWNEKSLPEAAWTWRRYAQKSTRWQETFPDRVRQVRYEDVLDRPADVLRTVVDWLGASFEEQMLHFHQQDDGPADPEREPWKEKTHRPVDPSNKEKWRTQMTEAERAVVEWCAGASLAEHGYPRPPLRIDGAFVRDLGRLLLRTGRTVGARWTRRWRTPPRAPDDHTPEWMRRKRMEDQT
jgi:hypothetical protein